MMTLEQARQHVGERVRYTPRAGKIEYGEIRNVGEIYVFVRYGGQEYGTATSPEDLELV